MFTSFIFHFYSVSFVFQHFFGCCCCPPGHENIDGAAGSDLVTTDHTGDDHVTWRSKAATQSSIPGHYLNLRDRQTD